MILGAKGGAKSIRQAKPQGTDGRLCLKRYAASSRPRFRRRIRRPFFFPFFRNAESVVRCAQLRLFVCVRTWQIYGLPECTAKIADEVTSSARAPGAGVQNSGVFCARSASAGVVTRYFSRCLIFWCFWIKPKAQKKKCTTEEIDSYFGKYPAPPIGRFLRGADLPPFDTKRWRQKCPQGTSVGIGRRFSLSGHKRLRCFARPLRALEPPSDLIPPPVQCGSVVRCAQP